MPFEIEFPVDWVDTDALGIVHFTNYFRYFERAETEFLRKAGLDYNEIFKRGFAIPRVEAKCKYYKPLKFGDLVKVQLKIGEIGEKHFKYEFQIFNNNKELVAEGYVVVVCIDRNSFKSTKLPESFIEKLKAIM
jgi:acyl-CoA thioester hydrolase